MICLHACYLNFYQRFSYERAIYQSHADYLLSYYQTIKIIRNQFFSSPTRKYNRKDIIKQMHKSNAFGTNRLRSTQGRRIGQEFFIGNISIQTYFVMKIQIIQAITMSIIFANFQIISTSLRSNRAALFFYKMAFALDVMVMRDDIFLCDEIQSDNQFCYNGQDAIGSYRPLYIGQNYWQRWFRKSKMQFPPLSQEAKHDLTGIRVAIKILNKRKMKNRNMISKVKRQIKFLRFISHPNIIKLYQVLDTTNDIFVIMELAEQGELFDYLQTHQISQDQAKFLFRQIINGVDYAHSNLISHRDLKPQNILIDSNKIIKIVDFGLSNLMKDGKMLKTACGSPNYAAPQIVAERRYEGTSVDIWSCGVILYTLIVGHLPFYEETLTLLYKKIQLGNYKIPNNTNPLAADLIVRMLQVDPLKRIRMHQIKNHPWIRPYVPIYSRIPLVYQTQKCQRREIDKEIFQQIKQYSYSQPITKTQSKMMKSIKKRSDDSFVVAYELLKDTKQQNFQVNKVLRSLTCNNQSNSGILTQIQNIVIEKNNLFSDFQYGRRYCCSIKPLVHSVLQTLKHFAIQYSIKDQQHCLKCIFHPDLQQNKNFKHYQAKKSMSEEIEEDNQKTEKTQKYSRKQIIFYIQFYSGDLNAKEHIIDLQLTQGHPLIFLNLSSKLYKLIGIQLNN